MAGLWNDAISFGEVVALIFADLLILPILNIYEVLRLDGRRRLPRLNCYSDHRAHSG